MNEVDSGKESNSGPKRPSRTRAGMVTIAGAPNVGKSTLLNRILGQKLAITSKKPQSTRDRVVGIHSTADVQMVILDTPGLLEPRYALQEAMRSASLGALREADVIVYLAAATEGPPQPLEKAAGIAVPPRAPIILALNKVDLLTARKRTALKAEVGSAELISATSGEGVEALLRRVAALLPESPFLYPDDELSTQPVRFFVAESIREAVLEQLHDEIPYSVACAVEEFREDRSPVYIRAVIYVERESQKGIVIGAKGARIRQVGQAARKKIEAFIGQSVYLDLRVKVVPNWRRSASALEQFGYHIAKGKSQ
jgi:GTP-binding protein Era